MICIAYNKPTHRELMICNASSTHSYREIIICIASSTHSHREIMICIASSTHSHREIIICIASSTHSHREIMICIASDNNLIWENAKCAAFWASRCSGIGKSGAFRVLQQCHKTKRGEKWEARCCGMGKRGEKRGAWGRSDGGKAPTRGEGRPYECSSTSTKARKQVADVTGVRLR